MSFKWLQFDVRTIFGEEVEKCGFIFFLNYRSHHRIESRHNTLVGGRKSHFVLNRGLEILVTLRNLIQLVMVDGHIDEIDSLFITITGWVTFLEKLLIHANGGCPLLCPFGCVPPHEQRELVIHVLAGSIPFLGLGVWIALITLLKRFHCVPKHAEFDFAIAPMIPEPTKAWPIKLGSPSIISISRFNKNRLGFGPLTGFHGCQSVFIHIADGGTKTCIEQSNEGENGEGQFSWNGLD